MVLDFLLCYTGFKYLLMEGEPYEVNKLLEFSDTEGLFAIAV